jgi:hypothetical protein
MSGDAAFCGYRVRLGSTGQTDTLRHYDWRWRVFPFAPMTGKDWISTRGTKTMRLRMLTLLSAVVLLSGCASQYRIGLRSPTPQPVVYNYDPGTYGDMMSQIAERYGADVDFYHPEHGILDIQKCYHYADQVTFGQVRETRFCMVLDYVAYKDWQRRSKGMGFTIPAFFSGDAIEDRWPRYAPRAHLQTPEEMFAYFQTAYGFVEPKTALQQNLGGVCVPGANMRFIPIANCLNYPEAYRGHRH